MITIFVICSALSASLNEDNLWKRFAVDLEISDLDDQYYQQAIRAKNDSEWQSALSALSQISDLFNKKEYLLSYIEILYLSGSYEEANEYIDHLPKRIKIRLFDDLIEYYILTALASERYDRISEFIEIQGEHYPDKISDIYKKILYSLLRSGNNQQVIELTDIFPSNIYLNGEKNFILGVAHYNQQYYRIALAFMQNVLDSDNPALKNGAYDYISLIAYFLHDPDQIPEDISLLSTHAKVNFALLLLERGEYDEANLMALEINANPQKALIDLFLTWESGHYKTARTLLSGLEYGNQDDSPLLNLIAGETLYHSSQYREAESKFRKYLSLTNIDEQYANHAIGYSFYGYYRFNSTAYYWIKNLTEEKSFYDSLAVYNLAQLYTHTTNYHTAKQYYDSYLVKYEIPYQDTRFIANYLETLAAIGRNSEYIDFFNQFGEVLSRREQIRILNKIGDYYLSKEEPLIALDYYNRVLELENNYPLILKTERIRFNLGEYSDSEDFVLTLLEKYPQSHLNVRLAQDLAKFYLNQKQYRKAISFIDEFLDNHDSIQSSDSLQYYSGVAHKELREYDQALDIFIDLHQMTRINNLRSLSAQRIENILVNRESRSSINFLINLIENVPDDKLSFDYLRILARVYEKAYLYNEANEIYLILLEQDEDSDREQLSYFLAVNELYLKRYEAALYYVNDILADKTGNYYYDSLFLSYLAHYSLDERYHALRILLAIYYDYPHAPKRFEIVRNLIELLIEMKLDLFAWHFFGDYYPRASRTEEFNLQKYGDYLIKNLGDDIRLLKQVMDIRTFIDLTINVLEDYED